MPNNENGDLRVAVLRSLLQSKHLDDAMMPIMRTTIQIDDELLMTLKEQARRQKSSLTHLVNQTLRAGLQAAKAPAANKPLFQERPHSMGAPKLCLNKALDLAAALEDEEITHCVRYWKKRVQRAT